MVKKNFPQRNASSQVETSEKAPHMEVGAVTPLDWIYKQVAMSNGTAVEIAARCGAAPGSFLERLVVQLIQEFQLREFERTGLDW